MPYHAHIIDPNLKKLQYLPFYSCSGTEDCHEQKYTFLCVHSTLWGSIRHSVLEQHCKPEGSHLHNSKLLNQRSALQHKHSQMHCTPLYSTTSHTSLYLFTASSYRNCRQRQKTGLIPVCFSILLSPCLKLEKLVIVFIVEDCLLNISIKLNNEFTN